MNWLALRLQQLLKERHLSIQRVANDLAIERAYLSLMAHGRRIPSEDLVRRMAKYFGEDEEEWAFRVRAQPVIEGFRERYPRMLPRYARTIREPDDEPPYELAFDAHSAFMANSAIRGATGREFIPLKVIERAATDTLRTFAQCLNREVKFPLDAELLVERFDDWQPVDFEPGSDGVVSDAAWDRVHAERRRELVRLIQDGAIAGKRSRRGYLAQQGAFYDWLGESTPVTPDWGLHYTVVPDDQAIVARGEQAARQRLKEKLDRGPQGLDGKAIDDEDTTETWEAIPRALARSLRAGILGEWLQIRAIEQVIDEVATEFGGEDPAKPKVRTTLRLVKAKLEELHQGYSQFVAPLELIEPDEEELDQVREYLEWADERLR